TIDRATMGQTRVRKGVKLDNLVHLAHNVTVGEHTVIVAQTGVAGSTRIGSQVMIGGQVAVAGHISVGDGARIGACSGVSKSVPAGETVFGFVARPIMKTKRIEAVTANLPELLRRVQQLEKKLEALQEKKS
ncbi:MAG: UDP-3-O-(3-hydroxymyristoyl)glucosamine N-acyltransferase, partial [Calditrichaeota bacterium]|nr:UDP-3-O-(3-hydroxymyristoyl)glucosamine N-acyltransferase [Calditrichota bacterium]